MGRTMAQAFATSMVTTSLSAVGGRYKTVLKCYCMVMVASFLIKIA
jgi:hypothetical protein